MIWNDSRVSQFFSGTKKVSPELLEGNLVVPVFVQVLKNLLYLLFAAQL